MTYYQMSIELREASLPANAPHTVPKAALPGTGARGQVCTVRDF